MWIVMTSAAKMPSSCWGTYRKVALVKLDQYFTARNLKPAMISEHAKGVLQVRRMGKHNVGKTEKCAYDRARAEAERRAYELNNADPAKEPELFMTWGGSA